MIGHLSLDKRGRNFLISVLWGKSSRLQSTKQYYLVSSLVQPQRENSDRYWVRNTFNWSANNSEEETDKAQVHLLLWQIGLTLQIVVTYLSYFNVCFKLTLPNHPSWDTWVETELNVPKLVYSSYFKTCCFF